MSKQPKAPPCDVMCVNYYKKSDWKKWFKCAGNTVKQCATCQRPDLHRRRGK